MCNPVIQAKDAALRNREQNVKELLKSRRDIGADGRRQGE